MRQDGEGTDERITPELEKQQPDQFRPKSTSSLERDVLMLAVIFAILTTIGWGAFYLSKRATLPSLSSDPSLQQAP